VRGGRGIEQLTDEVVKAHSERVGLFTEFQRRDAGSQRCLSKRFPASPRLRVEDLTNTGSTGSGGTNAGA
jgi:hypothetical protein